MTASWAKKAPLCQAIGISSEHSLSEWLSGLVTRLDLPTSLHALCVPEDVLEQIAEKAEKDHLSATNPGQQLKQII